MAGFTDDRLDDLIAEHPADSLDGRRFRALRALPPAERDHVQAAALHTATERIMVRGRPVPGPQYVNQEMLVSRLEAAASKYAQEGAAS